MAYAKTYAGLDAGAKPTRKSLKAGHRRADRTFGSARLGVHRAGLGGAEAVGPVARAHPDRASRRRRRQEGWSKIRERLDGAVERAKAAHPDVPAEVWAEDDEAYTFHRLGLKPVRRGVWSPKGEHPIALGHRRFEWLHVAAFVQPTTGETL